ncbi:MAG: phosphoheptose isomerase [Pyrinomonas sp.]|uniref:D-sedoheptulose-7-phosphate isomerase n=1 Tax=Pyrinomonas sp. TaxID=2080306 RepID=UPI00332C258C
MIEIVRNIVAESLTVKERFFAEQADQIVRAAEIIAAAFRADHKILLCGNGGSAADAQHIAAEFINRFIIADRRALPAIALATDGGVLTSISNDAAFAQIFARQIDALGERGDVLVALSTSGNSPNIVCAAERARARAMRIIGLLGRDGGRVAPLCDLALIVPSTSTQRIQETHNLLGHIICELVERDLFPEQFEEKGA